MRIKVTDLVAAKGDVPRDGAAEILAQWRDRPDERVSVAVVEQGHVLVLTTAFPNMQMMGRVGPHGQLMMDTAPAALAKDIVALQEENARLREAVRALLQVCRTTEWIGPDRAAHLDYLEDTLSVEG